METLFICVHSFTRCGFRNCINCRPTSNFSFDKLDCPAPNLMPIPEKANDELFATIYNPNPSGYAHCCVHYAENNRSTSGTMKIETLLQRCSCPVFDISNPEVSVIGLSLDNIEERGGVRIR